MKENVLTCPGCSCISSSFPGCTPAPDRQSTYVVCTCWTRMRSAKDMRIFRLIDRLPQNRSCWSGLLATQCGKGFGPVARALLRVLRWRISRPDCRASRLRIPDCAAEYTIRGSNELDEWQYLVAFVCRKPHHPWAGTSPSRLRKPWRFRGRKRQTAYRALRSTYNYHVLCPLTTIYSAE